VTVTPDFCLESKGVFEGIKSGFCASFFDETDKGVGKEKS
jgi:hypothetical protein